MGRGFQVCGIGSAVSYCTLSIAITGLNNGKAKPAGLDFRGHSKSYFEKHLLLPSVAQC